jgi:hypothetical protein
MPIHGVNKQKQAEIEGFLGWLEEYSGARVEDLTNKTKRWAYEGSMVTLRHLLARI